MHVLEQVGAWLAALPWWVYGPIVMLAVGAAEYYGEIWSIEHTHAVTRLPLGAAERRRRMWKARKWTFLLLTLGHADNVSASLGFVTALWAIPGSWIGGDMGTRRALRDKFASTDKRLAEARAAARAKNEPEPHEVDDDD